MLFIYPTPRALNFWMKDTLIPLSIGFFDQNQVLLNIEEMQVPLKDTVKFRRYYSKGPASYALEVPAGWFERHHITPGMRFIFLKNP